MHQTGRSGRSFKPFSCQLAHALVQHRVPRLQPVPFFSGCWVYTCMGCLGNMQESPYSSVPERDYVNRILISPRKVRHLES